MANKKDVMGYIAPADTQPLLDLLGGSKQLLRKFQGLLGLQLVGPSASCQTPVGKLPKTCGGTVKVANSCIGGLSARASPCMQQHLVRILFKSRKDCTPLQNALVVQKTPEWGDNNSVWFAKLLALFSYTSSSGSEIQAAFVRWLVAKRPAVKDKKHAKNLTLVQLKWEEEKGRNSSADIVELSSILGPWHDDPMAHMDVEGYGSPSCASMPVLKTVVSQADRYVEQRRATQALS
ncbi:TPA: hypothetical protein ACH3X1_009221 [Trebouxia sp. C0004]